MVDFSNREDVMEWLEAIEPEQRRREAAIVISARAALRVLPLLQRAVDSKSGRELDWALSEIVLPSFRCVALRLAAARYPIAYLKSGLAHPPSAAPSPTRAAQFSSAAYYSALAAETLCSAKNIDDFADAISSSADAADAAGVSFSGVFPAAMLDARWLADTGRLPAQLAREPLWLHQGGRQWATEAWFALQRAMLTSNEDWWVWIDWYDARLAGASTNEDLEIARVLIADEIWKRGPRAVNAEIARLVKEHERPTDGAQRVSRASALPIIPGTRPAAIEPEIDETGRIFLPANPATSSLAEATVIAALKSLSEFMNELADAAEMQTNVDKRMIQRLREISAGIPAHSPDNVEVFSLGHRYEELAAYKANAEDSWPPSLASRFVAMTLAFDRTLRRFAEWRSFVSEPRIEKLGAGEAATIASLGRAMSRSLREEDVNEIIDPRLPQSLEAISFDLESIAARAERVVDPIEQGVERRAQDVLESLNNILKRVVERGLMVIAGVGKVAAFSVHKAAEYGKAFTVPADMSLKSALNAEGEKFGPWIIRLLKRTVTWGAPVGLTWLISHFPHMFSWLEGFVNFIEQLPK